jgi:elongation factor 3
MSVFAPVLAKLATDAAAATELAELAKAQGVAVIISSKLIAELETMAGTTGKDGKAREGAMEAVTALCGSSKLIEPLLVKLLPVILDKAGDKVRAHPVLSRWFRRGRSRAARASVRRTSRFVQARNVQVAAEKARVALANILNVNSIPVVLPMLFKGMKEFAWQTKLASHQTLTIMAQRAPWQVSRSLPLIIPECVNGMTDTKAQVAEAATIALQSACMAAGNRDVEKFVPDLVQALAKPSEMPETVQKLGATTFVQQVDSPTLSMLVPVLARGMAEGKTAIVRKAAVIIDNMCKLVQDPAECAPFVPKLVPALKIQIENQPDPECRTKCAQALETLMLAAGGENYVAPAVIMADQAKMLARITQITGDAGKPFAEILDYVSTMCCSLVDRNDYEADSWEETASPYLGIFMDAAAAKKASNDYRTQAASEYTAKQLDEEEKDDGEDLCDCKFSLAYGAKILLNGTHMNLKRGKVYGIAGTNGVGKSTLMRAIDNGQVEGFPPKSVLRTVFVEPDISADQEAMDVVSFCERDPALVELGVSRETIIEKLFALGFVANDTLGPAPIDGLVTRLSGGWRMKLALARAQMKDADILMMDGPTNHMDVVNVAWLVGYVSNLKNTPKNVTVLQVSDDTAYLDKTCTNIIHFESNRKLKIYKGNLSAFVAVRPECKSYFELKAEKVVFKFPEPGFLEGVKDKSKAIIKMNDVAFKYPGATKFQISGITVQVSLASRVACIGENGAGKSTLIKVLTGELEATEGTTWKHPNLRLAYVAQHAFHHIEKHLDKTAVQYILWRYQTGEDREALDKVTRQYTEEELKKMQEAFVVDEVDASGKTIKVKKVVDRLAGRRKFKGAIEYEVVWQGRQETDWMKRETLIKMGFEKKLMECDEREAAAAGLVNRPLTTAGVRKHLEDIGLEAEYGEHTQMRALSGGQKVKVVIAACMWNNPHILVLDEPTNYLDRDSLGGLAGAIKEFGGGVLVISHNCEFCENVCPEKWVIANNLATITGNDWSQGRGEKIEIVQPTEQVDAFGNVTKIKAPKKKLSRQEQKQKERRRKAKIAAGEPLSSDDEEDF